LRADSLIIRDARLKLMPNTKKKSYNGAILFVIIFFFNRSNRSYNNITYTRAALPTIIVLFHIKYRIFNEICARLKVLRLVS